MQNSLTEKILKGDWNSKTYTGETFERKIINPGYDPFVDEAHHQQLECNNKTTELPFKWTQFGWNVLLGTFGKY